MSESEQAPSKKRRRPRRRPKDGDGDKRSSSKESGDGSRGAKPRDGKGPGRNRRGRRRGPKRDAAPNRGRAKAKPSEKKETKDTLSTKEVEEYKSHFAFLARYRKLLRLKPNATEDLLLNGVREPSHRGVCKHLLAKVDNAAVQSALTRLPDEDAKHRFLQGAVAVTGDPGVMVLYLESLGDGDRDEAAKACSQGLRQLDFSEVSAPQLRRVLELIAKIFEGHARTRLIFGLLNEKSFRHVFEAAAQDLPEDLVETFGPLSMVHRRVFRGSDRSRNPDPRVLERGISLLLETQPDLDESATANLVRCICESRSADEENASAVARMLADITSASREYSSLVMDVVRWLIAGDEEPRAQELLAALGETHSSFELPKRWLTALRSRRLGQFALAEEGADGYQRALWTRGMRPCWIRLGKREETDAMASEAELQEALVIPGLAPLLGHGTSPDGEPYLAQALLGRWVRGAPKDPDVARAWARDGIAILAALAEKDLSLPDIRSRRFVVDNQSRLYLTDLGGLTKGATPDATLALAMDWAQFCLRRPVQGASCGDLIRNLESLP